MTWTAEGSDCAHGCNPGDRRDLSEGRVLGQDR